MQLLYGKTQPVIGDSQAPQGSLPELEFKQNLFLYFFLKPDISYSIAIIWLSILLSAIKKKKKKKKFPTYTYNLYIYISKHFTCDIFYIEVTFTKLFSLAILMGAQVLFLRL